MKKVILPKEIAEAVEQAWKMKENNPYFVKHLYLTNWQRLRGDHGNTLVDKLADYAESNPMEYMSALVNGYEIDYTPEQLLRFYYEELKHTEERMEVIGRSSGSQFRQGWQSVEKTLNILGIEIEGINT